MQNYLLKTNAFPYILFYKKIDQQQINTSKFKNKQKVQSLSYLSIKSQVTKSISSISIDDTNAYESGKHNKYTLNVIHEKVAQDDASISSDNSMIIENEISPKPKSNSSIVITKNTNKAQQPDDSRESF